MRHARSLQVMTRWAAIGVIRHLRRLSSKTQVICMSSETSLSLRVPPHLSSGRRKASREIPDIDFPTPASAAMAGKGTARNRWWDRVLIRENQATNPVWTVASPRFCCTTELLHPSARARLRPLAPRGWTPPKVASKQAHVQTNSDRQSRRDRVPGHQDCSPDGD